MSDNLIRRQKFARDLRRKQVEAYMRNIRQRLLIETQLPEQPIVLTPQEFEQIRREVDDGHYTTPSVERFLIKLKAFTIESLCTGEVFAAVERAILHVLKKGENEGQNATVHRLAKELLFRAIEAPPRQNGSLPVECCFKQVQEILVNPDTEMLQVWKAMALLRTQAFYSSNFINFIYLLSILDNSDVVMPTILEIFANFTAKIEGYEKSILSVTDLFTVIEKLSLILHNYNLDGPAMGNLMRALSNMFQTHYFQAVVKLLVDSKIFPEMASLLKDADTDEKSKEHMLQFVILILSGSDNSTYSITHKHNKLINVLTSFLPQFGKVNPFQNFPVGISKQWRIISRPITNHAMTAFANIAACTGSAYLTVTIGVLNWYISFSSFEDPNVRAQVAIYFYNLCAVSTGERMEIILERGMLLALNNLIREEYLVQSALYSMKALHFTLKETRNFPPNNLAWNFSLERVRMECHRMGLVKYLQGMLVSKKEELAHAAEKCLNYLIEDERV